MYEVTDKYKGNIHDLIFKFKIADKRVLGRYIRKGKIIKHNILNHVDDLKKFINGN